MSKKFEKIKKLYDGFHREMLSKGRLMVKDTGIGYWGISPTNELLDLFKKTELKKHKKFIDLGSGDGRAAVVADLFTNSTGVEFDEELHNFAQGIAKKAKSKASLINQDFLEHELQEYDYLFIHPDNHIAERLETKLQEEMHPKAKLVVFGPHFHPRDMKKINTLDIQGTLVSIFKK